MCPEGNHNGPRPSALAAASSASGAADIAAAAVAGVASPAPPSSPSAPRFSATAAALEQTYGYREDAWDWRGHRIRYHAAGDVAHPAIILVHGFGGNADHWRKARAPREGEREGGGEAQELRHFSMIDYIQIHVIEASVEL